MTEIDHQLALLLQRKFDQELKDLHLAKKIQEQFGQEHDGKGQKVVNLSDSFIAKSLQEQFQKELEIDRPGQNLVYDTQKQRKQTTKSLTDPSWELIDPTPDIYNLFLAFNEKFFWNQLGSVCVYWSKRMTTCAGVCSYQGRGGLCTITLSEPLLKLRPRKDLVETLLHEMIHAYLFITNNNKDRDGHGPEFLKHMKRINDEAGTNITVYHDFHDEVNLYKQHWWRCNGPCHTRKPFFGLVRRAMNRPPGPNDFWWSEHSRTCGGEFIKVKEPEKTKNKIKSKTQVEPIKSPDIRKFFPPDKSLKNNNQTNNSSTLQQISKVNSNIVGFKNLNGNIRSADKDKENFNKNKDVSNTGHKLSSDSSSDKDYSVVRNHWINKFSNSNTVTKKRTSSEPYAKTIEKLPKLSENLIHCPVCSGRFETDKINQHLDECLNNTENVQSTSNADSLSDDVFEISNTKDKKTRDCDVCKSKVPVEEFDMHLNNCIHSIFDKIETDLVKDTNQPKPLSTNSSSKNICDTEAKVECLACNNMIVKSELNDHLEDCMSEFFKNEAEPSEGTSEVKTMYNCPSCMKLFSEAQMNDHIDICLNL